MRHFAIALTPVLALVQAVLLQPQSCAAQSTKVFSKETASEATITRAHALLKSDQIRVLREAAQIVRQYPASSHEFLPEVARRAGHPELTDLFRWLAKQNPNETVFQSIRQSTADLHPEIRELIATTFEEAIKSPPPPAGSSPLGPSPLDPPPSTKPTAAEFPAPEILAPSPATPTPTNSVSATTVPPGDQASVAKSVQETSPLPSDYKIDQTKPTVDGRGEMGFLVAKRKALFDQIPRSGALGNLTDQESKLDELISRPKGKTLVPIQWHFLFDLYQQPARSKGRSPSDRNKIDQLAMKAKSIIVARYAENMDLVWGFLADPQYTRCFHLVQPIARTPADPQKLCRYLWILADSDNVMMRSAAINVLPFKQPFVEHYVDPLIERMKTSSVSNQHFASAVIRIASGASIESREKLLAFLLDHLRRYLANTENPPERISQINTVDQAAYLLQRLPSTQHPKWLDSILRYAQQSKRPAAFLMILDKIDCDLRPASGQLHNAFGSESNRPNRLAIARLLYRALGKYSGVKPYFYSVIAQETPDGNELTEALKGIQEIGNDVEQAEKITSDLVRLLTSPRYANQRVRILTTLSAIGHKAAPVASPVLIELLADPEYQNFHTNMIMALDKIRPEAQLCLPILTMIALNQNAKCQYNPTVRSAAIRLIATYGADAKRYAKQLVPLTKSSSSAYLTSIAKTAIMEIESAR